MMLGKTQVYEWDDGDDTEVVVTVDSYSEFANIEAGKVKALLVDGQFADGATLVVHHDGCEAKLIVRSSLCLPESTVGTTLERGEKGEFVHITQRGQVHLVSFEPVVHRRRRVARRKAYRQLQRAYERLYGIRSYTELARKASR